MTYIFDEGVDPQEVSGTDPEINLEGTHPNGEFSNE